MSDDTQKFAKQPRVTRPIISFPPDPVIEAYKKDIDRTLLLENLKLTAAERFLKFDAFMQGVMKLRQAGAKFRQGNSTTKG